MSDISPKRRARCDENPEEIYRHLRERFALARFGGPLYAGTYTSQGTSGSLYVGELANGSGCPPLMA